MSNDIRFLLDGVGQGVEYHEPAPQGISEVLEPQEESPKRKRGPPSHHHHHQQKQPSKPLVGRTLMD